MNIRAQKRAQAAPIGTLILGDNQTARLRITVPRMDNGVDLSDLTWLAHITNAEGQTDVVPAQDVNVANSDIVMSVIVGGVATAAVGNTTIMIEGVSSNGSVWRSAEYYLRIDDAALAEPSEDDAQRLTALQELMLYVEGNLNAVIEAGDKAREAYQHPPVIGENGNWYVWDWQTKTYVDSGKPSQGGGSGSGGAAGKNGGYYVPHVDADGNLTWTPSDGSMPPVEGANIKGEPGEDAPADVVRYSVQTLTEEQQTQARDNIGAASEGEVDRLSEEIVNIRAQIGESEYTLLGMTPQTLAKAGKVKLAASETGEYSVVSPTVVNFTPEAATYTNCEISTENGEYQIRLSATVTAHYMAYAQWKVSGLTPGETYKLYLECTDNKDQPSNISIYEDGDFSATIGAYHSTAGNWFSVDTACAEFTTATGSIEVRIYVIQTGRDGMDSTAWLEKSVNKFKSIYINRESVGSAHTEIFNTTGAIADYVVLDNVPAGVAISATPACEVYIAEPEEEIYIPKSRHDGRVCVCFGDSVTGSMAEPNDYPSVIAAETGMTVINGGFGGCRMGYHPNIEYDAFSMYRLADAVATGDWTLQRTHLGSISSAYADIRLGALMAVDWSKVDFVTIAYGSNDINGNYVDNAENKMSLTSISGALRYSIEKLLTAYPHIKLLILTPLYRFWPDQDNIDSDEKQVNGNPYTAWGDALLEVAKEYKIPAVDMYRTLGLNKLNRTYYIPETDGAHPNAKGHNLIGGKVAAKLLSEY